MTLDFDLSRYPISNKLFIHGEWINSQDGQTRSFKSITTGQIICEDIQWANAVDVDAAVESASKGLKAWQALNNQERKKLLVDFANILEQNADELAWLQTIVTGKAAQFGIYEVRTAAETIKYYAEMVDQLHGERISAEDNILKYTSYHPYGVCAAILPYNGPVICTGMKLGLALAAGNAVILKTSDTNPLATLRLAQLSVKAGFPPGVVNCITGDIESGSALSSHMLIRKISFTGSISVGKQVQIDAAKSNLKSVTLELGGKSPVIVFPDAELEKATALCTTFLSLNGQGCALPTRAYIHESIMEELLPRIKATIQEYRNNMRSDPLLPITWSMPIFHERQRDAVRSYIAEAKKEATVLIDGSPEDPNDPYIGPTVFLDPSPNAKILKQEAFGPVLVIESFKDVDKVIEIANDTEYGLAAFVCTRDVGNAMRTANKLEAGLIGVNCVGFDHTLPFGGWKQSGQGVEHSEHGFRDWVQVKSITIDTSRAGKEHKL